MAVASERFLHALPPSRPYSTHPAPPCREGKLVAVMDNDGDTVGSLLRAVLSRLLTLTPQEQEDLAVQDCLIFFYRKNADGWVLGRGAW